MAGDKPLVHCLAARPAGGGHVDHVHLVTLEQSLGMKARGWWIVGPCPVDMHRLALWERAQRDNQDDGA